MSLFSELSVLEVCPERESRSKYFCFRISISREISFNSADAAKAKQARPILLKCQSFFFAQKENDKKKQNILRHILVYWKAARFAKTLSSKPEWFICFRPRIPRQPWISEFDHQMGYLLCAWRNLALELLANCEVKSKSISVKCYGNVVLMEEETLPIATVTISPENYFRMTNRWLCALNLLFTLGKVFKLLLLGWFCRQSARKFPIKCHPLSPRNLT